MSLIPIATLKGYVGRGLGHSKWLTVDQERIDQFAECTDNRQFIHVDPEKAAKTPFDGTIARDFLSLSLVPKPMEGLLVLPEGLRMAVNYGLGTMRFVQPVRVGSRVHLGLALPDVNERNPGRWLIKACATLEIEGREKPAYIAETLGPCFV